MNTNPLRFGDIEVPLGQRRDVDLLVSESYSSHPVLIPITVWRALEPGPTVFVTAAVHGDELNGTGIVRELLLNPPFDLAKGSLILVPVVNMLGLERHQRYLPDRRDLNRSFPGDISGSLARRFAHAFFEGIVKQSDYGIDLHTAAIRRTNYPNIRADLSDPEVKRLALAFRSEIVVKGKGPKGSFRRAACAAGCPTVILEAGEVWKIEPTVVEFGVRGISNVLIELHMIDGISKQPDYQLAIDTTKWIRADFGGILQFHVSPGDIVEAGQEVATNSDLRGKEQRVICSPVGGIVIGMTTLPVVTPGDPVCHVAVARKDLDNVRRARERTGTSNLHERLRDDLSTSFSITEHSEKGASGDR